MTMIVAWTTTLSAWIMRDVINEIFVAKKLAAVWVIGGAIVYRQCLALARRIHLTLVHAQIEGDTFFDGWRDPGWRVTQSLRHEADAQHAWAYSFITLERSAA